MDNAASPTPPPPSPAAGPPRRCLVTGAAGFVGLHLSRALLARGDRVVGFDLGGSVAPGVELIRGDLRDGAAVAAAAAGCDVVFHLASVVRVSKGAGAELHDINVGGTERVLEACAAAAVPRLVYCSSASVVFDGGDIVEGDEELPYARRATAYAATKAIAEQRVLAANSPTLATCALRPHIVFGPGDTRMLPNVLRATSGPIRLIVGDPRKLSDFTYVDNFVDALIRAGDRLAPGAPIAGRAYFISNGEPRSYWDFVNQILAGLHRPTVHRRLPQAIAWSASWINEQLARLRGDGAAAVFTPFTVAYLSTHHYFSHARATRDLGYRPQVDLDEGIRRTVAAMAAGERP